MKWKGGVSLVSRPPAFSPDGKLLLVCTGSFVSVFSVATGLLVNELEGHEGIVTSVNIVNYAGAANSVVSHVWTSSLDKTIRFWDYTRGQLIKTVLVGNPIHSMVIPKSSNLESTTSYKEGYCLLLVQCEKDSHGDNKEEKSNGEKNGEARRINRSNKVIGPKFRVVLYKLTTGKQVPGCLAEVSAPQLLVSSPLGGLVGVADNRKVWVWRVSKKGIDNLSSFKVTILHHTKTLQTLAFDPTETLVAGSDNEGRVLIWKNVGELSYGLPVQKGGEENTEQKQKNGVGLDSNRGVRGNDDAAALTTYHWHSSQVNFLLFSLDGAYLFSGGKEAVFVMWQLETGKQKFLPRLGSYLLHCAASPSDASIFSVACADNTIKLINIGTMALQKSIQGIKPPVLFPWWVNNSDLKRVALLPGAGNLVLPAEDMSLQFYDVIRDRQVGEVKVSQHNYTQSIEKGRSRSKSLKIDAMVSITHVVFSRDGSVMATAECRQGEDAIGRGSCLKFWNKNSARLDFSMSTQIDDPHGSMEVSALVYHPFSDLAVSCSTGGEFKVWVQDKGRDRSVSFRAWRCRSVASYRQKPMLSADISSDGSLLAVAAGEAVTLWNLSSNGLVHVLARNTAEPVSILRFVPSTRFLVAASCDGELPELSVWNLETLSVCWSYHVTIKAIAVDAKHSHIAVLGTSGKWSKKKAKEGPVFIAVFDSNSPIPRVIWNAQDGNESNIFWLSCFESIEDLDMQVFRTPHLLYLSGDREYCVFNPFLKDESSEAAPQKKIVKPVKKEGLSAFATVYGKSSIPHLHPSNTVTKPAGAQPQGKLFDCPSHLIYLDKIGLPYIESLLERRNGDGA